MSKMVETDFTTKERSGNCLEKQKIDEV